MFSPLTGGPRVFLWRPAPSRLCELWVSTAFRRVAAKASRRCFHPDNFIIELLVQRPVLLKLDKLNGWKIHNHGSI